ncbi:MAG: hypothetical protein AAB874_07920 [Patescibacteria group bacterium]
MEIGVGYPRRFLAPKIRPSFEAKGTQVNAIEIFRQAHASLFGVESSMKPTYRYGTEPMDVGRPPNERLIVDYLNKRQAALFAGARQARLQNKKVDYVRFRSELVINERALRATRVKPGQSENFERVQNLVLIFADIYNQAYEQKQRQLTFPRVAANIVADLFQVVFPEKVQQLDMKIVSTARAGEVLDFILQRYAPHMITGDTRDNFLGIYNALNVQRKPMASHPPGGQ